MTLVTLAGSSLACSSLEKRTVPVSFSIRRAEGAATSRARTPVVRASTAHSAASSFFMVDPPLSYMVRVYEEGGRDMRAGVARPHALNGTSG